MLANLLWFILFAVVLIVPGRLSVMYSLLGALVLLFVAWLILKPKRAASFAAAPAPGYEAGANGETVASQMPPSDGFAEAAQFEEQARILDEERETQELLSQNASQREASLELTQQNLAASNDDIDRSWQERLENGCRP